MGGGMMREKEKEATNPEHLTKEYMADAACLQQAGCALQDSPLTSLWAHVQQFNVLPMSILLHDSIQCNR